MSTKYDPAAQRKIGQVMHEFKQGELDSGSTGRPVKSRRQAVAIALSEARREGDRVPKAKSPAKKAPARRPAAPKSKARR